MKIFISISVFFIFLNTLLGDNCSEILKYGVFEKGDYTKKDQFIYNLKHIVRESQNFEEFEKKSGSIHASIKGIPASTGYKRENWNEWKRKFLSDSVVEITKNEDFNGYIETTSSEIVRAWENCVNSSGFHAWVLCSEDKNYFKIGMKYKPEASSYLRTVNVDIVVDPREKHTDYQKENFNVDEGGKIFWIKRTSNEAIRVILDPERGETIDFFLDEIKKQTLQQSIYITARAKHKYSDSVSTIYNVPKGYLVDKSRGGNNAHRGYSVPGFQVEYVNTNGHHSSMNCSSVGVEKINDRQYRVNAFCGCVEKGIFGWGPGNWAEGKVVVFLVEE